MSPDDFVPERWSSRPGLILRKDAFVPFSYGPYNCTGKPLAMMQLRMIIAMISRKFEIGFVQGKDVEYRRFIEDQADCFVMDLHPLPLLLTDRVVN
jgi:cytochrome P450 family 628